MSQLYFVVVGSTNAARQAAPLQGVAVTGLIRDAVAEYTVTQTYVNPLASDCIDAAYTFPLYEGAGVAGFQAEVAGRKIVGKVREKAAAREEYREAVTAGKTASLLEQEEPDVFQARIGNIPPGKTVSIRITLVSEIKQDAGENQVRFVLPTTVATRYLGFVGFGGSRGYFCGGLGFVNSSSPSSSVSASKLSVQMACAMSTPITSVQSPSHTMEVHVGTSEPVGSCDCSAFDPNRARVSLTADCLLDRDLVIIIQSRGLDQPRALVERHPADQTHAISLTFQPRFALQPLRASELVFLVDRSGSMMGAQMRRAGEALELFLRSIPFENHFFNVLGFGSTHQALFPTSVEYNAESLRMGVHYAQTLQADMGGTEMASAFQEVFQRRRRDVPTQLFLLTDGQIGNVQQLGRAIRAAVDDGERSNQPLRVFSLGVGDSVSHHLVEHVARAGGGYAQLVMTGERMEKKVVNMLKAALTPPVTHTAIQWSDSVIDSFVMVEGAEDADGVALGNQIGSQPLINLFTESPLLVAENTPPPEVSAPIHQAPYKIPVLCRGARFTVYAILSPTTPLPEEIVLRGLSPDGPVELRVKIESVAEGETMLHCLAARALVRDLEEASSPIHALGKTLTAWEEQMLKALGVCVAQREGQKRSDVLPLSFNHVAEITKQKMVDIGVRYSLSTKYTSWVAIDEEGPRSARDDIPAGSYIVNVAQSAPQVLQYCATRTSIPFPTTACFGQATPTSGSSLFGQATPTFSFGAQQAFSSDGVFAPQAAPSSTNPFGQTTSGLFGSCTPAFGAQCSQPSSGASTAPAFGAPLPPAFGIGSSSGGFGFGQAQGTTFGAPLPPAFGIGSSSGGFGFGQAQDTTFGASTTLFGSCAQTSQASPFGGGFGERQPQAGAPLPGASLFGSAPASRASPFGGGFGAASSFGSQEQPPQGEMEADDLYQQQVLRADDQAATSSSDPHTRLRSLLQHQSFDGLFPLVPAIAALFSTSVDNMKTKLGELRKQCTGSMELAEEQWEAIWATCLAIEFMKSKLKELHDEWELVVEKAERRVESLLKNSEHFACYKAAAKAA